MPETTVPPPARVARVRYAQQPTSPVVAAAQPTSPLAAAAQDPLWVRWTLTLAAVAVVGVLIVIPVVHVFAGALADGVGAYWRNLFGDADTRHSILLTLTVVPGALVANIVFGLAAAW